jgi:hypothetical protein
MDDQKQQEERWRGLAELLGLPDEGSASAKKEAHPVAPARPEPSAATPAIKAYEEPPAVQLHPVQIEEDDPRTQFVEETPSVPMMREEPMPAWEAEFEEDEDEDDTPLDQPGSARAEELEATEEEPTEALSAAGEAEKPRRRRRRRGRRRGGADKPEQEGQQPRTPAQVSTPTEPPAQPARDNRAPPSRPARDAEADPRGRRGRGRGKRRDDEEQRRPSPVRQERQEPVPVPDDADDLQTEATPSRAHPPEDDTDFSDWSVPSWQDLISALYRPDR